MNWKLLLLISRTVLSGSPERPWQESGDPAATMLERLCAGARVDGPRVPGLTAFPAVSEPISPPPTPTRQPSPSAN